MNISHTGQAKVEMSRHSRTVSKPVWVGRPACPFRENQYAVVDINVDGGNPSFVGRGHKLDLVVETKSDFSHILNACNLHFNTAYVSTYPTIPHNNPTNNSQVELKLGGLEGGCAMSGAVERVAVTECLNGHDILKTAEKLKAVGKDDKLRKAVRAYSESITSPHVWPVFNGLYAALDIVVNISVAKPLYNNELDKKAAELASYSEAALCNFRDMTNSMKHATGYHTTADEVLLRRVEEFRPVVAKLLRDQLWAF